MDLQTILKNSERRKQRAEKLKEEHRESSDEFEKINENLFSFLRDVIIFSGTIFGSSIALSINKKPNDLFITAEFFLFVSIVCGLISLWAKIQGDFNFHFLMSWFSSNSDLSFNKDLMEEFEKKAIEDSLNSSYNLSRPKGLLNLVLKLIKIDYIQSGSILMSILGVFLLWLSLFINIRIYNLF